MITIEGLNSQEESIAVVGLGYVGLPLAVHLSKHFKVVGYDLKDARIEELSSGHDSTMEVTSKELSQSPIKFTSDPGLISGCRFIIVAVPTPIDEYRIPDLTPLRMASAAVGENMRKGSCVVYESTVYPGATEEVCKPILEEKSGLTFGVDFTLGYSPERINPGDKEHSIDTIVKIISGSDGPTLDLLYGLYGRIVTAGLHRASSIKVAEAAKVIENTQRDLNIALMNELAMIFDKIGIDTNEVLDAAGTKWNFLKFKPGLVGGHCIGVDPYYLTFKAESLGYHPEMILAGRRVNDGMSRFIVARTVKLLSGMGLNVAGAKVAVLGITFKENVPDLRNTKVVEIVRELEEFGMTPLVHDPLADPKEAKKYYNVDLVELDALEKVDAVILAVPHNEYKDMGLAKISKLFMNSHSLIVDVKAVFTPEEAEELGVKYWRL